eukprot:TRINITY_DN15588_c0_g1_i2.p1 TRINITY_DN15588_c0_g1~~TRINITY_DN15588_c0_g1_i2.p1  ORF type:complete len:401 (+),score=72.72 TRINITY_DN15588_c0_g1_i2:160-1362(+)
MVVMSTSVASAASQVHDTRKSWTAGGLAALAAAQGGVSLGFGLQYALLTPFVLELGVPKRWASFLWLGGPVTGMVVQPLIGQLSDGYQPGRSKCCKQLGRRRPFLLAATGICCLAQLLVGNCVDLGHLLGDPLSGAARPRAALLFVLGFWTLDAGSNGVLVTSRALIVDVVPETQRLQAFSAGTLLSGLGLALGYLVGGLQLSELPGVRSFVITSACGTAGGCADVRFAFIVALLMGVASAALTVAVGKEDVSRLNEAAVKEEDEEKASRPGTRPLDAIISDEVLLGVFTVTLLTWFGWIAAQIFQSHFVAEEIYLGSPDPLSSDNARYVEGMHAASLALVANALLMAAASMGFSRARSLLGDQGLWMIGRAQDERVGLWRLTDKVLVWHRLPCYSWRRR